MTITTPTFKRHNAARLAAYLAFSGFEGDIRDELAVNVNGNTLPVLFVVSDKHYLPIASKQPNGTGESQKMVA